MTEGERSVARGRRVAKRMRLSVRTVRTRAPKDRPDRWPPETRHYEVIESFTGGVIHPFLITPGDVIDVCEQIARDAPRH
jgi:hypothetical protein